MLRTVLEEYPVSQHSPCYSAVSSSLANSLPDCSNYSPFATLTTLLSGRINTSLVSSGQTKPLRWRIFTSLLQRFTAESSRELMSSEEYCSALRKLNNKQRQVVMFLLLLLFKLSSQFTIPSLSSDQFLSS